MSRSDQAAQAAAQAASEAGRVLQAQQQAKAAERNEPAADDAPKAPTPKMDDTRQRMLEGMYEGRKKKAAEGAKDDSGFPPPGLPPVDDAGTVTDEQLAEEARAKKAEKAREEATLKARQAEAAKAKDAASQQEPDAAVENVSQEAKPADPAPAPTTSKQKVDGVEYDVPLAEIEEAGGEKVWRLNKAAQNRLDATKQAHAQMQAQLAAWSQQNAPKAAPKPSTQELLGKLAANRFGTDQEFAATFQEVLGGLVPQVDPNGIVLQATASIKRDQAFNKFSKEFSDVLANPVIKAGAEKLQADGLAPFVQNGQVNWPGLAQLDWDNFYSTIGNQVRGAVGRQSQPSQAPAAQAAASGNPSLSEKEARKASIVNLPQAAAARAVAPAEEKPETREEALNRMRKSRGIPTG